jgi:hypothetical protein
MEWWRPEMINFTFVSIRVNCENGKMDVPTMYEPSEVDIGIDALNSGVLFSKTKAFEVNNPIQF